MEDARVSRFKTVGEKHLFSEIDIMLWSPKVDLVAMTTINGEVVLYRITWQKVWSLPRLDEGVCVSALSWRPDGKVLAVGYTNGCVKLYNIEGGFCLHDHKETEEAVMLLKWISESVKEDVSEKKTGQVKVESESIDLKVDEVFLPELPPITNKEVGEVNKSSEDFMRLKDQKLFNLLLVGSHSGSCELFAFGIISIGKIPLHDPHLSIENMIISSNLKSFIVFLRDNHHQQLILNIYDTTNLQSEQELLKQTSLKLGKLETLLAYLHEALMHMTEVMEDILVEIESKLMRFAETKSNGRSLSFEFLRLLLYGNPSDDLKYFLQYELTKQAFSKLGRSVQGSYKQIQELLIKNLQSVAQNIIFHLKNLLSLSRCIDKYSRLGLDSDLITYSLRFAESLLLKSNEMVAVINTSLRDFNAFYKWLYPTKMKVAGESCEVKMTQQETSCVAQFLRDNFDTKNSRLKLEKLGQYLKDEDLTMPTAGCGDYSRFVEAASSSFKNNTKDFFPKLERKKSLVQLSNLLKSSFGAILDNCCTTMRPFFFKQVPNITIGFSSALHSSTQQSSQLSVCCFDASHSTPNNIHSFVNSSSPFFFTFLNTRNPTNHYVTILRANIASRTIYVANLAFKNSETEVEQNIIEVSFFDPKTLTLLLSDDAKAKMFLLDLSANTEVFKEVLSSDSVSDLSLHPLHYITDAFCNSRVCKDMQTFRPGRMSINGQRKIGTVASTSRKWIQLYLIDSDDEDEDDADENMDVSYADPTTPILESGALVCEDDKENSHV